jgi:hypothetical protein
LTARGAGLLLAAAKAAALRINLLRCGPGRPSTWTRTEIRVGALRRPSAAFLPLTRHVRAARVRRFAGLCNALARKADEYARDFGAEVADLSPPSPARAKPSRAMARSGAGSSTAAAASAAADGDNSDADRSASGAQKEADSEPAHPSVAGLAHANGSESDQKRRRYLACASPGAPCESQRARACARESALRSPAAAAAATGVQEGRLLAAAQFRHEPHGRAGRAHAGACRDRSRPRGAGKDTSRAPDARACATNADLI